MQLRELLDELPLNGPVVPLPMQQLLREPLDVVEDGERAEKLLLGAKKLLPDRLELSVALYKMYAYTNRFEESLALIDEVLEKASNSCGFPADWRLLNPESAHWQNATGPLRLYLYSLKATGFVLLRKGEIDGAVAVLAKLAELDPQDQVGGSVVMEMAERLLETEDD